jgi:Uma2 family endonuclease
MSAVSADEPVLLTWQEYIKFSALSDRDLELVRGQVHVMTSPTRRHDVLTQRINVQLYAAFGSGDGPCEVFTHSRKVRTAELTGFQPDVYVRCGPATDAHWDADARFVIEVLSPSNTPEDRNERLFGYLALPSAEMILFVDHAKRQVTVHERHDGRWREYQVTDGTVWLGPAALDFAALWPWLDERVPLS